MADLSISFNPSSVATNSDAASAAGSAAATASDLASNAQSKITARSAVWDSETFGMTLFESGISVQTGDGAVAFTIPAYMNGMELIDVVASVHTKGITGTTDIQIRRRRAGSDVDMLSTKITIGDEFFASDEVINTSNDDVNTGDQIYVDIDAIHSGTAPKGLSVVLTFK